MGRCSDEIPQMRETGGGSVAGPNEIAQNERYGNAEKDSGRGERGRCLEQDRRVASSGR